MLTLLLSQGAAGSYVIAADRGAFTFAGQAATLTYTPAGGYTLAADAGAFALGGQDAALEYGRRLVGDAAAFALGGQDAGFLAPVAAVLVAAPAAFVVIAADTPVGVTRGDRRSRRRIGPQSLAADVRIGVSSGARVGGRIGPASARAPARRIG